MSDLPRSPLLGSKRLCVCPGLSGFNVWALFLLLFFFSPPTSFKSIFKRSLLSEPSLAIVCSTPHQSTSSFPALFSSRAFINIAYILLTNCLYYLSLPSLQLECKLLRTELEQCLARSRCALHVC